MGSHLPCPPPCPHLWALQPPVNQRPEIPQQGQTLVTWVGGTPGLTLPNSPLWNPCCPCLSPCPPWPDPGWPGWLRGPMSTGDGEVPWGCEPLHPRLLWERGARAVQPPGAPVRPGGCPVGLLGVWGWAAMGPQPDPLLLLASGVLPLACIQARLPWPLTPLALVQVCGGAAPAAARCSPEAALPSAGAPGASRTTQGQA